ncbi:hypothetical protein BB559_003508 [Furculomyces boomerangus]|uniref:Uncharacterized protein n=2 Tax=Harpellales TaxID=61421 RepID=A0A2T9YKS4_9FUNG|nr:hypothetical protein BB559_003508 [Furculomyces boomerangus]PVZ97842.1 hypothetical protein BB558_006188 [Smittium angustum]
MSNTKRLDSEKILYKPKIFVKDPEDKRIKINQSSPSSSETGEYIEENVVEPTNEEAFAKEEVSLKPSKQKESTTPSPPESPKHESSLETSPNSNKGAHKELPKKNSTESATENETSMDTDTHEKPKAKPKRVKKKKKHPPNSTAITINNSESEADYDSSRNTGAGSNYAFERQFSNTNKLGLPGADGTYGNTAGGGVFSNVQMSNLEDKAIESYVNDRKSAVNIKFIITAVSCVILFGASCLIIFLVFKESITTVAKISIVACLFATLLAITIFSYILRKQRINSLESYGKSAMERRRSNIQMVNRGRRRSSMHARPSQF